MMDMIVNSLYSNREIFLRELVSNASDALDKARITALRSASAAAGGSTGESGESVPAPDPVAAAAAAELPLEVRIRADPAAQTISIEDTGIGMTRQELVDALGTIARSGTARFAAAMQEQNKQGGGAVGDASAGSESNLIGRFGVGFYSAFLVADRVRVETRSLSDECAWRWESSAGAHEYTVSRDVSSDPPLPPRGTRVTLHLKPEASDFADGRRLSELVRRYSEFVPFPIKVWVEKTVREPVVDQAATEAKQAQADEEMRKAWATMTDEERKRVSGGFAADVSSSDASTPPPHALPVDPVMTTREVSEAGFETANAAAPLWTRSARDVTDEERAAFYAATFRDVLPPLASSQFRVEGAVEFSGLLFVPAMAPMEEQGVAARPRNVRLYARRVFISDDFDSALLPRWAGFVRGVVDSPDVPLNVSREILQESRATRAISKQLVKRTLDMLDKMAKREEEAYEKKKEKSEEGAEASEDASADSERATDYQTFWDAFGKYVKVGVIEDTANRSRLAKLLRFPSSHRAASDGSRAAEDAGAALEDDPAALTGLEGYVRRMKKGQDAIYFLTAPTRAAALASPFVERLVRADVEVLLLTEPVDEIVALNLQDYDGKPFVDLAREGLDVDDILDRIDVEKQIRGDQAATKDADEGEDEPSADATKDASSRLEAAKQARQKRAAEREKEMAPLLAVAGAALGSRVERVAVSTRLSSSPAVVVLSRFGWSENMERLARAQAMGEPKEAAYMRGRKILELNPEHPIVQSLERRVARGDEAGAKAAVGLIYDAALLAGGYDLDSPRDVAERIYAALAEAGDDDEEEETNKDQ